MARYPATANAWLEPTDRGSRFDRVDRGVSEGGASLQACALVLLFAACVQHERNIRGAWWGVVPPDYARHTLKPLEQLSPAIGRMISYGCTCGGVHSDGSQCSPFTVT